LSFEAPLMRVTSRAVALDVVVTDRRGRPVTGLEKSDFSVFEDGRLQKVAFFEENKSTQDPLSVPRTILLVDQLNTDPHHQSYVRYSVESLLKHDGGHLQQPTALMALTDDGLNMTCDFTQDSAVLADKLKHLPPQLPVRLDQGFEGAIERINLSLQALQEIAVANQSSGRRQVVVWISRGFPLFANLMLPPDEAQKLYENLRTLSKALLDGRVTLYTVDPAGATVESDADRVATSTSLADLSNAGKVSFADAALQVIAVQSGGQAFYGGNDVDHEVASGIADGASFYTIFYYPSDHDFDGKFRKIAVSVDRSGAAVHTREGYYAIPTSPAPTEPEAVVAVQKALEAPLTYGGIPIVEDKAVLWSEPSVGRFEFRIPGRAVNWAVTPDGKLRCNLVIGAADFSAKQTGAMHRNIRTFSASFSGDRRDALMHSSFRVAIDLPIESPPQRVRFVTIDVTTGVIGSTDIKSFPAPTAGGPPPELKLGK
jgi:VWFA-related protein